MFNFKNPLVILVWIIIVGAIIAAAGYFFFEWFKPNPPVVTPPVNTPVAEVFTADGIAVNPTQARQTCDPLCLEPYPYNSQYPGYYYCKRDCSSVRIIQQPIYYPQPIFINPRPHPHPHPHPGPPPPPPPPPPPGNGEPAM